MAHLRKILSFGTLLTFLGLTLWGAWIPQARGEALHRPKLVITLVIDQFRADYLLRFADRFVPARSKNGDVGGFQYLMKQGAYYPMAEYGIAQSMTCPGHATILTGSYPYQAGIPLNGWFDTNQGHYEYCAGDSAYPLVGVPPREDSGVAPTHLIATTVGDELKNSGLGSRVVALALKDRAAVMLGGHRPDLVFWMDRNERSWVSSTFYLPGGKLPDWLLELNREIQPKAGEKVRFEAPGKGNGLSAPDFVPTRDTAKIGKTFPHELELSDHGALTLPYGLELTEQAAERAVNAYKLGQGSAPDLLAISFSSHDYAGHAFGPNSREMEEMTIHEDRVISKLLNHVRKQLPGGLRDVVIVLTGDHGIPPDPDWAKSHRMDAGMINEKEKTAEFEKLLTEKYGDPQGQKWIGLNHDFNLSLNRKALASRKAELGEVLALLKERYLAMPGIAHVYTVLDYEARKNLPGLLGEQMMHTYFPGRSGDLMAVPKPFWMIDGGDEVTHLTGYSYDRMVPLVLAGPGIRASVHPEYARVIDLAPTLSYLLGVMPPSLSEGRVLTDALSSAAPSHGSAPTAR